MTEFDLHAESTIVIVDDDDRVARFLSQIVERDGYEDVHTVGDPERLPALIRELDPDLVLLDLHMPHIDGFQLLDRIRATVEEGWYLPVLVITGDPRSTSRNRALELGASDFLTKPIDRVEGLLRIRNLLERRFLHLELQQHKARLEERVAERTRDLENAQVEILERLAMLSDFHDNATGEHTRRVSKLAALFARQLGLPEDEVALIAKAALLHDVGKVAIPEAIRLKAGRLTPDEFARMIPHTTIGARVLSGSRFPILQKAEEIALTHHERWDGDGYPHGLTGEDIPLAGRIVAVADTFDALLNERSYKDAWSVEAAVDEIEGERGRQFDPRVVDTLVHLWHAGRLEGEIAQPAAPSTSGGSGIGFTE